ncbi:Arc family DNA-binding protein [Candidatus Fukatsuia symbiotica]|uniref:Arc-like DNA binding domain-containing protein n=1 Tax=Candidatus Fukatsuia symbiotica TaxID=1878942 RepID=A0A2U8I4W2_9GAMM|nr:Arc family DNA-binding protein [Candidatus Fukatsuia symbiotica]AWK14172.1 hypothetical protein CCS41_06240 [Candidatus Fukatsuia symbiotica]MEA9446273.1 Arc family DNA-binding protein [Candidatus Fukatsuia symbiotica]
MARSEPQINIRLPQNLKDQVHELAALNKRSVNAEVIAAIELVIERNILKNRNPESIKNLYKKKQLKIEKQEEFNKRLKKLEEELASIKLGKK